MFVKTKPGSLDFRDKEIYCSKVKPAITTKLNKGANHQKQPFIMKMMNPASENY